MPLAQCKLGLPKQHRWLQAHARKGCSRAFVTRAYHSSGCLLSICAGEQAHSAQLRRKRHSSGAIPHAGAASLGGLGSSDDSQSLTSDQSVVQIAVSSGFQSGTAGAEAQSNGSASSGAALSPNTAAAADDEPSTSGAWKWAELKKMLRFMLPSLGLPLVRPHYLTLQCEVMMRALHPSVYIHVAQRRQV